MDNQIEEYHATPSGLVGRKPPVFCDVCSMEIFGYVYFHKDAMVCLTCYDHLRKTLPLVLQPKVVAPIVSSVTIGMLMVFTTPGFLTVVCLWLAVIFFMIYWRASRWDLREDA